MDYTMDFNQSDADGADQSHAFVAGYWYSTPSAGTCAVQWHRSPQSCEKRLWLHSTTDDAGDTRPPFLAATTLCR